MYVNLAPCLLGPGPSWATKVAWEMAKGRVHSVESVSERGTRSACFEGDSSKAHLQETSLNSPFWTIIISLPTFPSGSNKKLQRILKETNYLDSIQTVFRLRYSGDSFWYHSEPDVGQFQWYWWAERDHIHSPLGWSFSQFATLPFNSYMKLLIQHSIMH